MGKLLPGLACWLLLLVVFWRQTPTGPLSQPSALVAAMNTTGWTSECRLVLLGDTNVGKSSLVLRFVKNQFNADQVTTVGAAFLQSPVPLDDSEDKILFGIWDTAGSERYKALAPMVRCGVHMCPTFPLVALAVNLLCPKP